MRFAILAYSCIYPINAGSREEALNRAVAFNKERKVTTGLNHSPDGKTAFNIAWITKAGEIKYLSSWNDLKSPLLPEPEPPDEEP